MTEIEASAPGKLILMGEHAAVFGRPALVAAIDRRVVVRAATTGGDGVRLCLPAIGVEESVPWPELRRLAEEARRAWADWDADRTGDIAFPGWPDPARVVRLALGESALFLDRERPPGLSLALDSELPSGCGCGSSAAVAVAVSAAVLTAAGVEPATEAVAAVAMECERRQHGRPSGVDHRTIVQGGVQWASRGADGALELEAVAAATGRLRPLEVYQSGAAAEGTGVVVAAVRRCFATAPEALEGILDRMEAHVRAFRAWLCDEPGAPPEPVVAVRGFEAELEGLGVVPAALQARIRAIEAGGGAAKISGAGALTGTAAGCLLVWRADGTATPAVADLPPLEVRWGAPGLRVEAAS